MTSIFDVDEDVCIIARRRQAVGPSEPNEKTLLETQAVEIANEENIVRKRFDELDEEVSSSLDLGIDKAVSIRTRRPIGKLDDERLLSEKGLVRIMYQAPQRIRWKGKGHEFSDLQRLLSYYQVWAHELFPKARFREVLRMIQKCGHLKRVRVQRTQWIRSKWEKGMEQEQDDLKIGDELKIIRNKTDMEILGLDQE
ncbi:hypothetical protein PCANB_000357 [Pneumocystis canis]|nr:hypothetical protein PCANB_000357 [Pneumocystis canis]